MMIMREDIVGKRIHQPYWHDEAERKQNERLLLLDVCLVADQ
jgi:hypothetical protein